MNSLFASHIALLQQRYEQALAAVQNDAYRVDCVLLHSGMLHYFYGDDQSVPFRAFGHFSQWLPVNRPEQMVLVRPGHRPCYFQVVPEDFWYEQTIDNEPWWSDQFDITRLAEPAQFMRHAGDLSRVAFIGEAVDFARTCGIDAHRINPDALLAQLDYQRAYKSPYEIERLRQANRLALQGHDSARQCFLDGGSEYQIHMAFLQACQVLEQETAYTNIVALDEKAAILHYQNKRRGIGATSDRPSQVLLIDAGCRVHGYCSDITRTSVRDTAPEVFHALAAAVEDLQQQLVAQVVVRRPYLELHRLALRGIARILVEHEVLMCSIDEALDAGLASVFMPHGVGHLLGIQVHDVGGRQQQPGGGINPPPGDAPMLRNTRLMEAGMVFTVEPGLYFIATLLQPLRKDFRNGLLNWTLIDALMHLGGIRIEDNVLVTEQGPQNLTRGI
ncbi:MAG: hypothetical protein RLZZ385_2668 [Pseudomonadota bacterium]